MHLANNMASSTLNTYLSIYPKEKRKKKAKHIKENLSIHLKQNNNLNMVASISSNKTYQKQNVNILKTLIILLKTLTQMHEHFFFVAKLQCHSYKKEETTTWESTTQVERITLGRFSLLKHKGKAKFKSIFIALCAAKLQDLRIQTKEQLRKIDAELRILTITLLMV